MDPLIWALSLHITFLLAWSGALLYLPVLFLQQATAPDADDCRHAMLMQRWLYAKVMTPAALLAVGAGTWLVFERGFSGGWLHVKLALVLLMAGFHVYCGHLMVNLRLERVRHHLAYYRLLPLAPAALITAIFWLVTGKPF